ncbi:MAG: HAD-IA family hydrolase [bacterium]|nr:HAD-IA family hydrolase [bacterium]
MQTKILLFDFDGTIADSADAAMRAYNEVASQNNYRMISKADLPVLRSRSAMDNVRDFGIPLLKLPFIVKKVRTALKKEIPNFKAIEGMAESLKLLKGKGYKLYIISSNSRENMRSFLEHNRIDEFDDIYSVSSFFGKHAKIKSLLKAHHWEKSFVMYIGDEVRDIEAARKADVTSVAVTWGYNTEKALAKNNPDILLRNPSELSSL